MNALDSKIHDLFLNLVNSGTEHLVKIDYSNRSLGYKIDEKCITLRAFTKSDNDKYEENTFSDISSLFANHFLCAWDVAWCDPKRGLEFSIRINNKYYRVNGLSRMEYAKVLDTLDATIRDFESKQLDEVFSALSTYDEIL